MAKLFSVGFWEGLARIILRNRIIILLIIIATTVYLAFQWTHMRRSYTEANLLPEDHQVNLEYNNFLNTFGEEGNLIVIGIKDSTLFESENLKHWLNLSNKFKDNDNVSLVVGLAEIQKLKKNVKQEKFEVEQFINEEILASKSSKELQEELFTKLPFYNKFLFNKESHVYRTAIYLDKKIVNSEARKWFVKNDFIPIINEFEKETGLDVHSSGMPYIRTMNSDSIIGEIGIFISSALLITSIIFFFFFRSFRATLISMCTVVIGVMWTFGFLGILQYEITVLTAIIPPLIIVIGIPNCIFLINKYQQEVKKHGNKAKSLQRVISKIGNATLMTNFTTAAGFATFVFTNSKLLIEFGIVASISIISIFFLSLLIIPIVYSFLPKPKPKHLKHLSLVWVDKFVSWMENLVKNKKITIYVVSLLFLIVSLIGLSFIKVTGSLIEDMPKNTDFYKDIYFYEDEFNGVLPVEIMVDTKRKNGATKLSTIKRMSKLEDEIDEIPELSRPMSMVSFVKYAKQAFYNGNPKYYQVPTTQEKNFILPYLKNSSSENDLLKGFTDSTKQVARISTFMKDVDTDKMQIIEDHLRSKINHIFPEDKYDITITGRALVFQKGTKYLRNSLFISIGLAILLIAIFMAIMFRSTKMIVISLIPNLLPLVITAGVMGILGIPIKPSTILVFSIAFGISVDDTIHFLAKYRQELLANNWKIRKAVYAALRETGVSMFYTSIVLFFGFSVFMLSGFGGTVALGGLVSMTLLFAMLSNLLLLPCLLLSLEKSIANKNTIKKPTITILSNENDE